MLVIIVETFYLKPKPNDRHGSCTATVAKRKSVNNQLIIIVAVNESSVN